MESGTRETLKETQRETGGVVGSWNSEIMLSRRSGDSRDRPQLLEEDARGGEEEKEKQKEEEKGQHSNKPANMFGFIKLNYT